MSDGATVGERLNNAIVKLDWNTPAKPKGVKTAIAELAAHWVAWWDSSERKLLPQAALWSKLERYARWYARGYALVPADVRAKLPHPRELDVSLAAIVDDEIKRLADGVQAAAKAGTETAVFVKEQAKALQTEITAQAEKVIGGVVLLGVLAIGLLLAFGWQKGR